MIGPEHYREAERLLVRADHLTYGDGADPVAGAATATQALAHAVLAQAAATAAAYVYPMADGATAALWRNVIVPPKGEK